MPQQQINFSNPNDPHTKQFLQELGAAIQSQVITLTEMYHAMCDLNFQKMREEKVEAFLAEQKYLESVQATLNQNAKILNAKDTAELSPDELTKLTALMEKLQESVEALTKQLEATQTKIIECEREIRETERSLDDSLSNMNMAQASMLDEVANILDGKKITNLAGEEVTLKREQIENITPPPAQEFISALSGNNEQKAEQFVNYFVTTVFSNALGSADPNAYINPQNLMKLHENNPHMQNIMRQFKNDPNYRQAVAQVSENSTKLSGLQTQQTSLKAQEKSIQEQISLTKEAQANVQEKINSNDTSISNKPSLPSTK